MMPRPKRQQPYDPSKVHDRRATDLVRNAQVAPVEIDDPYEPGSKLMVMRSLRDDPLANLQARGSIDEAQYLAGRRFQSDFEAAERGPRAMDPGKECVDGGRLPEPITEAQWKAGDWLAQAHKALGLDGSAITHDVLIGRLTLKQVGLRRGFAGERWENYFGMRFRECLERLAKLYGLVSERC